jgi:hypothetical protein
MGAVAPPARAAASCASRRRRPGCSVTCRVSHAPTPMAERCAPTTVAKRVTESPARYDAVVAATSSKTSPQVESASTVR